MLAFCFAVGFDKRITQCEKLIQTYFDKKKKGLATFS